MRPPSVRLYVGATAAVAVAATAALLVAEGSPFVERPLLVGVVALLIGLEHTFATRIAHGTREGETTTHEEAYIVFLALLEPTTAVLAAVTLGFVIGSVLSRRPLLKAVFNISSLSAAVAVGMLVTLALGGAEGEPATAAAAAVAGVGVFAVLNRVLFVGVLAVVGAASLRATLREDVWSNGLLLVTNAAIGLLAGLAARESLATLPLALVALMILHFSLTGHGRARAESEKLRQVFDASTNGIIVLDDRGNVSNWSSACTEITGLTPDEVRGKPMREVRALLAAAPYEDPHTEPGVRYASRIRTRAGELRWLIVTRAALPEGGELLILHDDTARRTVDELRAAQLQARTRANLVSSVSHEFRTPLTSIIGFTSTLLHRDVDEEQRRRYLRIIHEQAGLLDRLVQDLLDLGAVDANALQLTDESFDVTALVRRVAAAFETPASTSAIEVQADARPVLVRGDVRRIEQVVGNLLSNALKYSAEGSPVRVAIDVAGDEARISVRDEGVGIPPEHQESIFTPFFRTGDTDAPGTGLGLAIARQLVVLHGGVMRVSSAPGKGSEFVFTLPREDTDGGPEGAATA